jgi:hypothetical protein
MVHLLAITSYRKIIFSSSPTFHFSLAALHPSNSKATIDEPNLPHNTLLSFTPQLSIDQQAIHIKESY